MLVKEKLQDRERFSDIDSRIADYMLERQERLREDSVRQIAKKLYVAPSSVIRFCQKLGYVGFNELREEYLKELLYLSSHFQTLDPNFPFDRQDKDMTVANKIVGRHERMQRPACSFLGHSGIWLSKTQGEEGGTGKGASIQRISEGNRAVLH